ncbi:endonuclease/exonuclease/phosphatase family protein [Hamadaea sp. NPDC051192]|uniref:endonuclease/exonuclease/phosphatase family protein n=1 Tax=Hamadaea sp. NPDC051192 TaxID=3154940 RepID=UPI0034486868
MVRRSLAILVIAVAGMIIPGAVPSGAAVLSAGEVPATNVLTTPAPAGAATANVAVAATVGLKVISHNICGGMCQHGTTTNLPVVANLVDAYSPHLMMFQEVCYQQFEWFGAHTFTSGQYQLGFTAMLTDYTGCGATNCAVNEDADPSNDDRRCWIGQVMAARGTLSGRDEISVGGERHQINGSTAVNPRTFRALCFDVSLPELGSRVVKGCSVHFRAFQDPAGINKRARTAQATRLASDLDGDIANRKIVVVGGDFNSHAVDPAMDAFYRPETLPGGGFGMFYEADQDDDRYYGTRCSASAAACRSGAKTLGTATKYDYIFYSETVNPASVSALPIEVADTVSDHDFYRGLIEVSTTA